MEDGEAVDEPNEAVIAAATGEETVTGDGDSLTYRPSSQGWASRVLPLMYVYLYYVRYGFLWLVLLPFFLSFIYLS